MNKNIYKNKKGLQFKSSFFALLIVSMVITGVGIWIADWNTHYDAGLANDLGEFSKTNTLSGEAQSQKEGISPQSAPGANFEDVTFTGSFGIINSLHESFSIVFGEGGLIDSAAERFGIEDYVTVTLIAMMVIAITFSIIAIIFRLSRDSA